MSDGKKKLVRSDKQTVNTDNETTMFIPGGGQPQQAQQYGAPQGQQPYYGQPQQAQQYGAPQGQQPYYGQPQQPQYGAPQGQQPYYGQPQYGAQQGQQPYYGQPQQPQYGAPQGQQPYYGQPQQVQYSAPQQPYYGQPQPQQRRTQQSSSSSGKKKKQQSSRPKQERRTVSEPVAAAAAPSRHRGLPVPKFIKRFITTLILLALLLFGCYSCASFMVIKRLDHQTVGSRVRTKGAMNASYVSSILLIGTDGRLTGEPSRSDTMILMSINSKTKEVVLTSFMRDCYVNIPGYGYNKLNSAYVSGGAGLLMDTIESNFNVKVDDYVCVNFVSFANIVDAVGGLDLSVSDAEAGEINTILQAEVNGLMGDDTNDSLLSGGGKLHLNGKQVLSYARIRYIGNADFERTSRQREVLTLLAKKLRSFKPSVITGVVKNVVPNVGTNMSDMDMYTMSLKLPFILKYDFRQVQIPAEGTYWEVWDDNAGSALGVDFDANQAVIKDNVFTKEKTAAEEAEE